MAKVSPARSPCKTFHGYSESTLYIIGEVSYNYMTFINVRTIIRDNSCNVYMVDELATLLPLK